jgi:hypothetical protein
MDADERRFFGGAGIIGVHPRSSAVPNRLCVSVAGKGLGAARSWGRHFSEKVSEYFDFGRVNGIVGE